jgi:xanthine dehydrogenase accessory factor
MRPLAHVTVLVKGAGEQATGIAYRLRRCHFRVCMTEIAEPTAIRRGVSFSEAVRLGATEVEGVRAVQARSLEEIHRAWDEGSIPVVVDPHGEIRQALRPRVVVDAILAKVNLNTSVTDAPVVIGVGPGFEAGPDVHAAVETNRGHNLGRIYFQGHAEPDTGVPAAVNGKAIERVLRTPKDGIFEVHREIGEGVRAGEVVATVGGAPMRAEIAGMIRGMLPSGLHVPKGIKAADIDPRMNREYCFQISDKARTIAGGVLEAVLMLLDGPNA